MFKRLNVEIRSNIQLMTPLLRSAQTWKASVRARARKLGTQSFQMSHQQRRKRQKHVKKIMEALPRWPLFLITRVLLHNLRININTRTRQIRVSTFGTYQRSCFHVLQLILKWGHGVRAGKFKHSWKTNSWVKQHVFEQLVNRCYSRSSSLLYYKIGWDVCGRKNTWQHQCFIGLLATNSTVIQFKLQCYQIYFFCLL